MKSILIFFAVFYSIVDKSDAQYFTVSGSKLIKPQKLFSVSVAYQGFKSDEVLQIGLLKGDSYDDLKNITINGSGVQTVDLKVFPMTNS